MKQKFLIIVLVALSIVFGINVEAQTDPEPVLIVKGIHGRAMGDSTNRFIMQGENAVTTINLDDTYDITSYYLTGNTNLYVYIDFYNDLDEVVFHIPIPDSVGNPKLFNPPVMNVKKIVITNTRPDLYIYIHNFELYGYLSIPDTTPPDIPQGLTAVPGATNVQLSWTANTEPDLAGYNVYMDGVKVNTERITTNSFDVTGLTPETQYSFTVTAIDTSNNESDPSDPIIVTTLDVPDTTPPAAPIDLTGIPDAESVYLSWTANTEPDLAGYNVYVDGVKANSELITSTNYTVTGLTPETEYSFTVTAVDTSNNESDDSAVIVVTTTDVPVLPPDPPTDLTAKPGSERITLKWTASTDPNLAGYNVYVDGVKANSELITSTSYTVTGLSDEVTYTFYVTAVRLNNLESSHSNTVQATPLPSGSVDLEGIDRIASALGVIGTAVSFIRTVVPDWLLVGLGIIFAYIIIRFLFWIVQKIRAETKFKNGKVLSVKEYEKLSKEDRDRYLLKALERQDKNLRGANYEKIVKDLRGKSNKNDVKDRAGRMSTKEFDERIGREERQKMYDYLTAKGRISERDAWVRNTGTWGIKQRDGRSGRSVRPGRVSR